MELKRLERAIADRWALVVIMAIIGVAAALLFGSISSENQESLFESTAAIRFASPEGGTAADLAAEIAEARELAGISAEELLEENPDWLIVEDLANQRLTFVALGSTREIAEAGARELRQAYLDIDPTLGGAVDELLEQVQREAHEVQDAIEALTPTQSPADEAIIATHALIDQKIAAINTRLIELLVEEAGASSDERADIATQRSFLNAQLAAAEEEKAGLAPIPSGEPQLTVEQQMSLAALQRRLEGLTSDYQRLYLRQLGVTEDEFQDTVSTVDLTPEPTDPIVNAAIGLLGGLLVAVLAVMFINRTRKPIWLAEDVGLQMLGTVPARKLQPDTSENWYDTASAGPRKNAVQALRSSVEAQIQSTGSTIALTGLSASPEGVQGLAADLASSMASAGTSVLLVDANFESRSPLGQYKASGASVSGVLGLNPMAPEFEAQVRNTVENAFRIRSDLSVLPSGPPPASPADQLAGRQFRHLLAVAQELYDVVVVVVDSADTPSGQVAMQRLGYAILVLTPGHSTIPETNGVVRDLERLRIGLLGMVFLEKDRRFLGQGPSDRGAKAEAPVKKGASTQSERAISQPAQSPISRLHTYPTPAEGRSGVVPISTLDGLADNVGAFRSGEERFEEQLIRAIQEAPRDRAADSVAVYLVSQTEDMVLARHGHGGLSSDLISAVSDYGFITLRPLRGFETASGWLGHEISQEVEPAPTRRLIEAMEEALGGEFSPVEIDEWLDDEFLIRHIERTSGEPKVWHLTSPERVISILVPARRLTLQQLELILDEVVRRTIDDLERQRAAAVSKSNLGVASDLERRIEDARFFERAVSGLVITESNGKRNSSKHLWRPDWSRGTRDNLAPLQSAGLLPFNVLSNEEMSDLLASA